MKHESVRQVIKNILDKPIKPRLTNDIVLSELFHDEILIANKLKIIQMRLGKVYEELAVHFNWIKVDKIDLIDIDRKYALELKASTQTDNSSSREHNYQKLLKFKEDHNEYNLYYLCINHTSKNSQNKLLDNGITFLTGKYALEFLYGENFNEVITCIQQCVKEFINSDISKLRETPKASLTTSFEKSYEGSQVMTDPNGKINEDITMDNPQPSS